MSTVERASIHPTSPDAPQSPERNIPGIRVIINGQQEGAALLFDSLTATGHEVVGVIATVKKDKDGKNDPLRQKALDAEIPIVNLGDINMSNRNFSQEKYEAANQKIREMDADIAIGFYLQPTMSDETIALPKFGSANTHFSMLPLNAGRDAMNRDILEGNDIGITVFMMNEMIDGGDIVDQRTFPNPGDKSQGALYYQYLEQFVRFASDSVDKIAIAIDEFRRNGTPLPLKPQDLSKRTYFEPLTDEELRVEFETMTADLINRKVNAGGPGAKALIEGVEYKLGKPSVQLGPTQETGKIIDRTDGGATIEATQGLISIGRLQKTS